MYDLDSHRGVLNDFDLARSRAVDRKPSSKDNTGTLPFLALDLLIKGPSGGLVQHLYRHDAESFTWCLIYICACMRKDDDGQIRTITPHPLSSWSASLDSCFYSKTMRIYQGLLPEFHLHQNIKPLATLLYHLWVGRYWKQSGAELSANLRVYEVTEDASQDWMEHQETVRETELYEELPDKEWFKQHFQLLLRKSKLIPREGAEHFLEMAKTAVDLYPYIIPSGSNAKVSK